MRLIQKGPQPPGLQAVAAALRADLGTRTEDAQRVRARTEFNDQRGLLKLGAALESRQRHLCVFCERRIGPTTVEHWTTVKDAPERALDWDNLFASCPTEVTCNHVRGDKPLRFPSPEALDYGHELEWGSDGRLFVRDEPVHLSWEAWQALRAALPHPGEGPGVLGLNHPALVEQRKAALRGLQVRLTRYLPGKANTRAARRGVADRLAAEQPPPEFVSLLVSALRGTLRKAGASPET